MYVTFESKSTSNPVIINTFKLSPCTYIHPVYLKVEFWIFHYLSEYFMRNKTIATGALLRTYFRTNRKSKHRLVQLSHALNTRRWLKKNKSGTHRDLIINSRRKSGWSFHRVLRSPLESLDGFWEMRFGLFSNRDRRNRVLTSRGLCMKLKEWSVIFWYTFGERRSLFFDSCQLFALKLRHFKTYHYYSVEIVETDSRTTEDIIYATLI